MIERWLKLYTGPVVVHRYKARITLTRVEQDALATIVETWRARLADLSWYMRCLNETIARMANKEDNCTGRFWEGRFRSQALLDEAALISCMAYVDLNPIRARTCRTLEQSEFTSIQERLKVFAGKTKPARLSWLLPLDSPKSNTSNAIPIRQTDYFALVDWTGRAVRSNKRGAIPADVQPILEKLGVVPDHWIRGTQYFGSRFTKVFGHIDRVRAFAKRADQKWLAGIEQAKILYH